MRREQKLKKSEHVLWRKEPRGEFIYHGIVFERVRAKARPTFAGEIVEDKLTQKEVTYIITSAGKYHWINQSMLKFDKDAERRRKDAIDKHKDGGRRTKSAPVVATERERRAAADRRAALVKLDLKKQKPSPKKIASNVAHPPKQFVHPAHPEHHVSAPKPTPVPEFHPHHAPAAHSHHAPADQKEPSGSFIFDLGPQQPYQAEFSKRFPHPDPYKIIEKMLRPENLTSL